MNETMKRILAIFLSSCLMGNCFSETLLAAYHPLPIHLPSVQMYSPLFQEKALIPALVASFRGHSTVDSKESVKISQEQARVQVLLEKDQAIRGIYEWAANYFRSQGAMTSLEIIQAIHH